MYRSWRRRYCNNMQIPEDVLEEACQCVQNNMHMETDECECGFDEEVNLFPSSPQFGQSYVPYQFMNRTFIPSVGLEKGTIFPELVSPYEPCQSVAENAYIMANNEIKGGCNDERM